MQLPFAYTLGEKCLFQLQEQDTKSFLESCPGFSVQNVYAVQNAFRTMQFTVRCKEIEALRAPDGDANVRELWHSTKLCNIENILQFGLKSQRANRGFFGHGIYFTDDPMKANDYCPDKGNPDSVRVMLRCSVALGRTMEYEVGRFDRDLVDPPGDCHSVTGFIRRSAEFSVYNNTQVLVTHVIFYRFTDPALELTPSFSLPPSVSGQIVYITTSLSEFFGKLQMRASTQEAAAELKRAIASLLKRTDTVDQFLARVSETLKAAPPEDLKGKIETEITKCRLPPPRQLPVMPAEPTPEQPTDQKRERGDPDEQSPNKRTRS